MNRKSTKAFLELVNATFRLGDRLVFEDTTWRFGRKEQWAVVGPNASGKSLFGEALRGNVPLMRGELRYYFRSRPSREPESAIGHVSFNDRKEEVHGMVVQSRWNSIEEENSLTANNFLSYQRVLDINPYEIRTPAPGERAGFERRRAQAIRLLGLGSLLDRALASLSNGERQRVQLARALCLPSRLLILDEPFSGLDAIHRQHIRRVLEALMRKGLRLLILTSREEELPSQMTHVLRVGNCRVKKAECRRAVSPSRVGKTEPDAGAGKLAMDGAPNRVAHDTHGSPLVQLRAVRVHYGDIKVLEGIDWTIYPGQSWGLLGPNGAGKTTLLSLITGDHPQAYGNHVVVFGKARGEGSSIWELKQQIGWVSPELQLHFEENATGFEVVASGFHESIGLFQPVTARQRQQTREWMQRFRLLPLAETPLFGVSDGLQRMLLLARAMVKKPKLLVLDEPCQGLDRYHRQLFTRTLNRLLRAGLATAIYVTHRPEEIPGCIRRILQIEDGRAHIHAR